MGAAADANMGPAEASQLKARRLLPPGEPATAKQVVDDLGLPDLGSKPTQRPYVLLNMVSTVDGRATIGGRSGPISGRADRELFRALRTAVDAVMVGAGTVRAERYGPIIREQGNKRLRRDRGLSEEPLACIVSARLSLLADVPLLADEASRVAIVTASAASLPECAAQVDYVRAGRDGAVDLQAALAELRERFGVRTLLCEGGPHLNSHLLAAGIVDELFLTLAPKLGGGDTTGEEALRIVAGPALEEVVELELIGLLESESELFLRYGVCASAPERVSRETTSKSSLAR
jgi:riboflavin-specific deaminase-like protein